MASNERVISGFTAQALQQLQTLISRGGGKKQDRDLKDSESKSNKALQDGFRRLETAMGRVAAGLVGSASGLAARGFQGTAEGARLSFAMDRLAQQMAAVFQPIIQGMTYAASRLTLLMSRMNGDQQNRLLGAGIGASAGYMVGGPMGALAGGTIGATFRDPRTIEYGVGAGAYAGYRVGGPLGALAGGTAAMVATAPEHGRDEKPFEYYSRMRREGASRLGAAFATGGRALGITLGIYDDEGVEGADAPKTPEPRRPPPIKFQPAETEAGTAAQRAQEMVLLMTSGTEADGGPYKEAIDTIIQLLAKIANVELERTDPVSGDKRTVP